MYPALDDTEKEWPSRIIETTCLALPVVLGSATPCPPERPIDRFHDILP